MGLYHAALSMSGAGFFPVFFWRTPLLAFSALSTAGIVSLSFYLLSLKDYAAKLKKPIIFINAIFLIQIITLITLQAAGPEQKTGWFQPSSLSLQGLLAAGMVLLFLLARQAMHLVGRVTSSHSQHTLRLVSLTDELTGLPNRLAFHERLSHSTQTGGQPRRVALIAIDLNRFKEINDLRGHHTGDEVLRILGRRLKQAIHNDSHEFVARTAGDQFVALCHVDEDDELSEFLYRLRRATNKPLRLQDDSIAIGANFGITFWPDDATDHDTLITNAKLAVYHARDTQALRVCYYHSAMHQTVSSRLDLLEELRHALARNQLSLHYQMQKSIAEDRIVGFEALLRWTHPRLGSISPAVFIPLAEENSLIQDIGAWVLRTACHTASQWREPYRISVNVSPEQFRYHDLLTLVQDVVLTTGLPPERLELELTESTIFVDKERALHTLRGLKALGISLAIDDYGTGYSSLDLIRSFGFDRIKMDKSFISHALQNTTDMAIIRSVIFLGRVLDIPVLAEGVETEDQLAFLENEGCHEVQGFLLSRPIPLEQLVSTGCVSLIASPA